MFDGLAITHELWKFLHSHFVHAGLPLRAPAPSQVILFVTSQCNLRCPICRVSRRATSRNVLQVADYEAVLRDLAKLGVRYVSLTGGEPLMRTDLFDILKRVKDLGLTCHLNTNGALLHEREIGLIAALGVDGVTVGLDGPTAAVHDRVRGRQGVFAEALRAVTGLVAIRNKHGMPKQVGIGTTVLRWNLDQVPDIVDLGKRLGVDKVRVQPIDLASVPDCRLRDDVWMREEDYPLVDRVFSDLLRIRRQTGLITSSEGYLRISKEYFKGRLYRDIPCYAGYSTLVLDEEGNVFPCFAVGSVGNVRRDSVADIWFSDRFRAVRRDIAAGRCAKCWVSCHAEVSLLHHPRYALSTGLAMMRRKIFRRRNPDRV